MAMSYACLSRASSCIHSISDLLNDVHTNWHGKWICHHMYQSNVGNY